MDHPLIDSTMIFCPMTCFSLLLGMIKIQDKQFHLILKVLSKSCTVMLQHNPFFAVMEFFESEKFVQQFINITKVIDELWMFRKDKPEQVQEWRKKHRQIFQFRSILLKFLGSVLTFRWVQDFKERAEKQRVRVWIMDGQWYYLLSVFFCILWNWISFII